MSIVQIQFCYATLTEADHCTTYQCVQIAAIAEFIALDLFLFIAIRTAPNQSCNNPAEKIGHEMQIRSLNSLKSFRKRASRSLKEALNESMNEPLHAV
ncbi:hypothetical protein MAR_022398 [Mya arenaria]|uniref:Uncharacterized protein n=1 Tax=Mya arenaria TaxID=6604 RepID=A0ABY7DMW0_MYAAR|nr:hypothetical protein MAR_022398 [Mya arenaria]